MSTSTPPLAAKGRAASRRSGASRQSQRAGGTGGANQMVGVSCHRPKTSARAFTISPTERRPPRLRAPPASGCAQASPPPAHLLESRRDGGERSVGPHGRQPLQLQLLDLRPDAEDLGGSSSLPSKYPVTPTTIRRPERPSARRHKRRRRSRTGTSPPRSPSRRPRGSTRRPVVEVGESLFRLPLELVGHGFDE